MNPLLGRWISADPLAVHAPGEADLDLYAYVTGRVLVATDPIGLECGVDESCDQVASTESGSNQFTDGTTTTDAESSNATNSYNALESSVERYDAQAAAVDEEVADRNESESLPGQDAVVKAVDWALGDKETMVPGETSQSELSKLEDVKQGVMVGTAVVATAPLLYFGGAVAGAVGYAAATGTASGLSAGAVVLGGASLGAGLGGAGEIAYGINNYEHGGAGFSPSGYVLSTTHGAGIGAAGTYAAASVQGYAAAQGFSALQTMGVLGINGTSVALGSATAAIAMETPGDPNRGGIVDGIGSIFTPLSVLNVPMRWQDGASDAQQASPQ